MQCSPSCHCNICCKRCECACRAGGLGAGQPGRQQPGADGQQRPHGAHQRHAVPVQQPRFQQRRRLIRRGGLAQWSASLLALCNAHAQGSHCALPSSMAVLLDNAADLFPESSRSSCARLGAAPRALRTVPDLWKTCGRHSICTRSSRRRPGAAGLHGSHKETCARHTNLVYVLVSAAADDDPAQLACMDHPKVVNSAFFSPRTGTKILTTCIDNRCASRVHTHAVHRTLSLACSQTAPVAAPTAAPTAAPVRAKCLSIPLSCLTSNTQTCLHAVQVTGVGQPVRGERAAGPRDRAQPRLQQVALQRVFWPLLDLQRSDAQNDKKNFVT